MKIAVFSDVHSSYEKMLAVFDDMEKFQIDRYICLGDIIGYGNQPEETIQLLISKNVTSVRGNHELAMFNPEYLELFPTAIKEPLLKNIAAISGKSIQYLEKTPVYLKLEDSHFVHGTPPDKMTTYIYDVTDYYLKSVFNNSDTRIFFTGHTHKLKMITYKDRIVYRGRINKNCIIPVENNQKYLINVGSIGFSRDDFEASKYVVYDTDNKQIMVRMVTA
ncbi:MAG: metallophosphatase family protein [Desulfotignum sp.]|nr:metallophosphatase family protein [Desulfotignum sp.]MCF8087985.1 metallophosphatase family protein [Desulfotignum sp.]MCF8137707.1 metallophosphatase family protein [Desulfotignum sp.]